MRLVLFDIDGTLTVFPSSERLFARFMISRGELRAGAVVSYLWFIVRYGMRFRRRVFKKNKAYLSGMPRDRLRGLAEEFVIARVMPGLHPAVLSCLREHQLAGDRVALLSGTPDFIARRVGRKLGVDLVEATRFATRGGRYTGVPPLSHPLGREKADCAARLARQAGLPLEQAVVYANSRDDLALMHRVGVPIAVNPDRHLRRIAQHRGWQIIDH